MLLESQWWGPYDIQVSHPIFEHLLGLEELSLFSLEIMWKKMSYQFISAISTISVIQAQAERVCPFTIWQPAKYLRTTLTFLLSIFAIRLNISSSFTLFSHNAIPKPLTLLIALSWTYSRFPMVTLKYVTWPAFSTPDGWWVHWPHSGLPPTSFWCSLHLLSYPRLSVALLAAPSGLFHVILNLDWLTPFIHRLVIFLLSLRVGAPNICINISQSAYISSY